jgi:hypothetical protein
VLRLSLLLSFAAVAAACGGAAPGPVGTDGPTPNETSVAATTTPAAPVELAMCTLVPLGDVQGVSPFSTPLAEAVPGTPPSMCEYRSAADADEPVGVLLAATDFGTPEMARAHMAAYRENMSNAGVALAEVAGVGDEAVSSGSDEVGVHAIAGRYALDANFGGEWPDTPDAAKVSAATNILKTLVARLD